MCAYPNLSTRSLRDQDPGYQYIVETVRKRKAGRTGATEGETEARSGGQKREGGRKRDGLYTFQSLFRNPYLTITILVFSRTPITISLNPSFPTRPLIDVLLGLALAFRTS